MSYAAAAINPAMPRISVIWTPGAVPRKTEIELDQCPYECGGGGKAAQRALTDSEIARLPERARHAVESTLGEARICSYCGCVHLREAHANVPLGLLDGKTGSGWHSRNFA